MTCTLDRCTRDHYARGYCEMHYKRWKRNGDPSPDQPKRGTVKRACTVQTCDLPVDAHGLCHGHFQRLARTGSVQADVPLSRRRQPEHCTVTGCSNSTQAKGLCGTHYSRARKHGEPRPEVPVKSAAGNGWISHGYRCLMVPPELRHLTNGEAQIAEHRLVMAMHLGRPLAPDEVVHHINGVRTDNRIENLEVWVHGHPKGQRVSDKVDFAVEMLRRYRPELLASRGTASALHLFE